MIQMLACTYMLGAGMQLINLSLVIFPEKVYFLFCFVFGWLESICLISLPGLIDMD